VLENKDVEDVATSQDPQNPGVPPQPQLEQANQSLVAQCAHRSTRRT
jgi:penicillin-binding protein 1A